MGKLNLASRVRDWQYDRGGTFEKIKRMGGQVGWCELVALVVTVACLQITYNLYLHPLAKFPGPFWARSSLVRMFSAALIDDRLTRYSTALAVLAYHERAVAPRHPNTSRKIWFVAIPHWTINHWMQVGNKRLTIFNQAPYSASRPTSSRSRRRRHGRPFMGTHPRAEST
jgi:hypothetical protein